MNRSAAYRILAVVLVLAWLALGLVPDPDPVRTRAVGDSAEEWFALGRRYPFARADTADLLLIEGVSDLTARRLLDHRTEILRCAAELGWFERHRAFELVEGIGEKTAVRLGRYLGLGEIVRFGPSAKTGRSTSEKRHSERTHPCTSLPVADRLRIRVQSADLLSDRSADGNGGRALLPVSRATGSEAHDDGEDRPCPPRCPPRPSPSSPSSRPSPTRSARRSPPDSPASR